MSAIPQASSPTPQASDSELPAALVAVKLGLTERRVRQLCNEEWGPAGLARRADSGWMISAAANPLLGEHLHGYERDLQQEVELTAQGVTAAALADAKRRREILRGYAAFRLATPRRVGDRECKVRYLASLGPGAPSITQYYEWDAAHSADGLRALVDRRKCRARQEVSIVGPAALAHIERIINAGNSIRVSQAIDIAKIEAARHAGDPDWSIPAYRTVLAAVKARRCRAMKVLADKGPRAARAACVPKMLRDFGDIPAGDEYVGDEKTLDVWCRVWTARGWRPIREIKLTAWADMRSRVIVGWLLAAHANSRTILAALKKAIRDFGKPLRLRVDRGKDYQKAGRHGALKIGGDDKAPALSSILTELGIDYRHVEGYSPWTKPIESFFKTFKLLHDQMYGGFWGGCPSERHEDRQAFVKAHLEKLPTLDDVAACVAEAVRLYHHSEHSAPDLFRKTPLAAMAAFRDGPVRRETDAVLDHLFKMFVGPKLVRRDGVRLDGVWYGHGDARLFTMQGRRVLLAIQPDDASRATVCDLDRRPLFEVECYQHRGLSIDEVREKHRQLRRLLKPLAAQQKAAREWFAGQDPRAILSARADAAQRANPAPASSTPPLTVVRPDLEQAIAQTGPAPSEAVSKAASKALRTGTDDADIELDDLLDPSGFSAPRAPAAPDEPDEVDDL